MTTTNDEVAGVMDAIATSEPSLAKHVADAPKPKQTTPEPKPVEKPAEDPKTKEPVAAPPTEDEEEEPDTQDFSRTPADEPEDTVEKPAATEPSKTETETPVAESEVEAWKKTLPSPPPAYAGKQPEVDEQGQITNMTPQEYTQYITEVAKADLRQEMYVSNVENQALDYAEKILPEIKTNPAVRQMVQNARVASIINGQQIDAVTAALQVKEALGITTTKLAEAKAEGAQNAKTSITIQKNAAVETKGASQTKPQANRADKLAKRLKAGDNEAFVELFDGWEKEGKI